MSSDIPKLLNDGTTPIDADGVLHALAKIDAEQTTVSHPAMRTVADSQAYRGDDGGGHAKNLFLRNKKGNMVLVTMLEDRVIDLRALGEQLGFGKLSFASPERLMKYLGVIPGAVTPLAVINDKALKVSAVLDQTLLQMNPLHFHPCDNTKTTSISKDSLIRYMTSYHRAPTIINFD